MSTPQPRENNVKYILIGLITLSLLSGCAVNGFTKYYMPRPRTGILKHNSRFENYSGEPRIYAYSGTPKSDNIRAEEDGYIMIGYSAFYGPPATMTKADLIEQAKRVQASLVLIHSKYKDTITRAIPWSVPNPPEISTVNTNGTVSSYGSGGYTTGTYAAQSTITSPGGVTTYELPYSVTRNDVVATFWKRLNTSKFFLGVLYNSLPDSVSKKLQRNTGVIVVAVVRGTPAFDANILRGDVIVGIDGRAVIDPQGFNQQIKEFSGQTVHIALLRRDKPKTITVKLRSKS